jgi:flavin-dependent dehydrogenase
MFDAVIIGGGVAGAACALALAHGGGNVCVLEGNPAPSWRIGETLGPEARPVLQSIGVWDEFTKAGHLPCHGNASAWGWDKMAEKDFIFNPHGSAWQLDRAVFEGMLARAAEKAGAVIRRGQAVEDLEREGGKWHVRVGAEIIAADWLIDATGRRAMVARKAGVKREILDQLVAIYCVAISPSGSDQDSRTFIESCPDGWWYSALMPGGRRTISFQTDADLLPGQDWRTSEWFSMRLGETRHISKLFDTHDYAYNGLPQLTSAHSGRLEQFSGDGWLAIGDAAMSFDPLSGQGILKAMQLGIKAAEVVTGKSLESRASFDQWNEATWNQFAQSRSSYYSMERRWPDPVFWARRGSSEAHRSNQEIAFG